MQIEATLIVTGLIILYFGGNIIYDLFTISKGKSEDEEVIDISYFSEEPIVAEDIIDEHKKRREQELKEEEAQRIEARYRLNSEEEKRKKEEELKSNQTYKESLKELQATQEQEAIEKQNHEMLEAADIAVPETNANVTNSEGCNLKSIVDEVSADSKSNIFFNFSII